MAHSQLRNWKSQLGKALWPLGIPLVAASFTALAVSTISPSVGGTGDGNICGKTASDALAGCQTSAQSDHQINLGKCANITDPAARKACEKQAASDLADALQTCRGGFQVRQEACQRPAPAGYDPVIDPTNFTTVIDNRYFPLTPGTTYVYETKGHGGEGYIPGHS